MAILECLGCGAMRDVPVIPREVTTASTGHACEKPQFVWRLSAAEQEVWDQHVVEYNRQFQERLAEYNEQIAARTAE